MLTFSLFARLAACVLWAWGLTALHPYRNDFWGVLGMIILIIFLLNDSVMFFVALGRIRRLRQAEQWSRAAEGSHTRRLYGNKYRR